MFKLISYSDGSVTLKRYYLETISQQMRLVYTYRNVTPEFAVNFMLGRLSDEAIADLEHVKKMLSTTKAAILFDDNIGIKFAIAG